MDLLEILKDKKAIIQAYLRILLDSKTIPGLRKMNESQETNLEVKVKILTEIVANQQADMKKMAATLLVYSQGTNFDSDIAGALAKMGRGEEALKAMFESKLNGR